MKSYDVKIRFFGDNFKDNLHNLESIDLLNKSVNSVSQQMIAIHLGRSELAPELKQQIKTNTQVNSGVLEIDINFEQNFSKKFGISGSNEHQESFCDNLARLFYSAMSLRSYVAEAKQAGHSPAIVLDTSPEKGSRSVVKTEQGEILISHPKVLWAAQMTKEATDTILRLIDGQGITGFEFDGLSRPLICKEKNSILLEHEKADLAAITHFSGQLKNLVHAKQRGVVVSDSEIFQVVWDEDINDKILSYVQHNDVQFLAVPNLESQNQYGELVSYKILDCLVNIDIEKTSFTSDSIA